MAQHAPTQSARRSLLFMPGDSQRKIEKALTLEVDTLILDLEDGVALNQKEAARQQISAALKTFDFGRRERIVRINPVTGPLAQDDLAVTITGRPNGYLVPKVEDAADLVAVSHFLTNEEHSRNWPADGIRLLAMVETAKGVMNLREICTATPRLDALIFGAEDFASSVGAQRTRANWEVFYARSALITAAGAYNLQPIDQVFIDLNDLAGLEEECLVARQLGFIGKTAIHPRQVEVINRVFAPSAAEIEQAQQLVAAFEQQQTLGAGAFAYEGKMVDMPVVRAAQRILTRARQM